MSGYEIIQGEVVLSDKKTCEGCIHQRTRTIEWCDLIDDKPKHSGYMSAGEAARCSMYYERKEPTEDPMLRVARKVVELLGECNVCAGACLDVSLDGILACENDNCEEVLVQWLAKKLGEGE